MIPADEPLQTYSKGPVRGLSAGLNTDVLFAF